MAAATMGFALAAIVAGVAIAAQQLTNYGLRVGLGSVLWAGFFSYLGGTLSMAAALVLTRTGWPGYAALARVEPISWIGGALGALYIAISIFALSRLGVALLIALVVVGQMLASLAFDRFALMRAAASRQPAARRRRSLPCRRRRSDQGRSRVCGRVRVTEQADLHVGIGDGCMRREAECPSREGRSWSRQIGAIRAPKHLVHTRSPADIKTVPEQASKHLVVFFMH